MYSKIKHSDLPKFYKQMERNCGVKFIYTGLYYRLAKMFLNRIFSKFPLSAELPNDPMCLKNIVLLPFCPGNPGISVKNQIKIAVHECAHAHSIGNYLGSTARWYGEYFTKPRVRALDESAAQKAVADLTYYAEGHIADFDLPESIYRVSGAALELATNDFNAYRKFMMSCERGTSFNSSSSSAIMLIRSHRLLSKK